jgi:ubiquitin-like domain-containing CTD phosphatase 1
MSNDDNQHAATASTASVTLVAKYGKEKIELSDLPPSTNIGQVKLYLRDRTGILPKRQKIIGLKACSGSVTDETLLSDLKARKAGELVHQFILMGTPEEQIFVDPSEKEDLPDVIDDFDFDFNAGSDEVSMCI